MSAPTVTRPTACHPDVRRHAASAYYRGGPAPRGMDRFATWVDDDGTLVVDTSTIVEGPSRQLNALDQPPEGASCL